MTAVQMETIPVRVMNAEDLRPPVITEEAEPEHFTCTTFVLQAATANNPDANLADVLKLDPQRKDATIMAIDNAVVVCHTYRQTKDPANQVAGVPFPNGSYLPAGAAIAVSGTGPLWVVATTVASNSRVSVAINRRGSA